MGLMVWWGGRPKAKASKSWIELSKKVANANVIWSGTGATLERMRLGTGKYVVIPEIIRE
jgi:hypothetical protein